MAQFNVVFNASKVSFHVRLDTVYRVNDDVKSYTGKYTVTPTVHSQTLETANKRMVDDLTIEAIPYYSVDNQQKGQTVIIGG